MEINSAAMRAGSLCILIGALIDSNGFMPADKIEVCQTNWSKVEVQTDARSFSQWLDCVTMPELF